jgi:RNA polymerase sigma factor (sigma-70 family)
MAAVPSIGRATSVERPATPEAAAAGDLYERYSPQIFSYCLHQLGSREEAEDAVQTTFMNAFRGLSRGIVPELESAWLFKIAHNVCLSRRRSSWRRGKVESPNNFEVLQEVIPGREHVGDELIRLQDVLEEMPENQRRAILLREWQGMTYREISSELGLSQAATETLIFRARRALAAGLEQNADTWKGRLGKGSDFGGVIGSLWALLSGGSAVAVKAAATAVVVATTAVAASPNPTNLHSQRATDAKPAITKKTSAPRQIAPSRSVGATVAAAAPSKPAARKSRSAPPQSANRSLPRPVSVATFGDQPETPAPAPAASPAPSQPEAPAAQAPPAPSTLAPAPDRETHSAQPAAEPAPAPIAEPEPTPQPQPEPTPPGHENQSDKQEQKHENKPDKSDKPEHENNGKRQEKRDK